MEPSPHRLLGVILVDLGYVRVNEMQEALRLQMTGTSHRLLGAILIEQGWLTRERLSEALAIQIKEDWGRGAPINPGQAGG